MITLYFNNIYWEHPRDNMGFEYVKPSTRLYLYLDYVGINFAKLMYALDKAKAFNDAREVFFILPIRKDIIRVSDDCFSISLSDNHFARDFLEKSGKNSDITIDCSKYKRESYVYTSKCCTDKKEEENMYITGAKVASKYYKIYPTKNIPGIMNVEIFDDNLLTVKVTFADGSHTTATCSENDTFDFDAGIGICIAKRAIPNFNNLIKKAGKLYERKVVEKEKKAQAENEEYERKIRKEKKRLEKAERREQEWRQEQIDILAAAIKKAREESGSEDVTHKDVFKIAAHMLKQSRERDDRNKKILELHDQGKSYGDISKELGISRTTVGRVVRESNKH